jgi:hypothetical protein
MNISNENLNLENELSEEYGVYIQSLLEEFGEVEEIELPDDLEEKNLQELKNIYHVVASKMGSERDRDHTMGSKRVEVYKRKIYANTPEDAIKRFNKLHQDHLKRNNWAKQPRVVKTEKNTETGRADNTAGTSHVRVATHTSKGLRPGFRNPETGKLEHPHVKHHISSQEFSFGSPPDKDELKYGRKPIKRAVYRHLATGKHWKKTPSWIRATDRNPNRIAGVGGGNKGSRLHGEKGLRKEESFMEQKIKDLIDNIEIGNADAINASFSTVMAEKVSARLDSLKQEVANVVFKDKIENNEKNN